MPPPTGTHQSRSASRSMNRTKRGHMSKESLTLNMPLLHLLSSQPVMGSVRKLPSSIRDSPPSSLINGTSPTAPTMNWLRCTLSFCLLQSSIQCICGARSSIGQFAKAVSPVDLVTELAVMLNFDPVISPFLLHHTIPSKVLGILFFIYICCLYWD